MRDQRKRAGEAGYSTCRKVQAKFPATAPHLRHASDLHGLLQAPHSIAGYHRARFPHYSYRRRVPQDPGQLRPLDERGVIAYPCRIFWPSFKTQNRHTTSHQAPQVLHMRPTTPPLARRYHPYSPRRLRDPTKMRPRFNGETRMPALPQKAWRVRQRP